MNAKTAIEILNRNREKNAIVCLYTSKYSSKFAAGFIERISEKHVVLRSLSVNGRYDGWILRELDDLCRIDYGGRYEEKLLSLYQMKKENHPPFLPPSDLSTDLKGEILMAAQKQDYAVSIDMGTDEDVCGFVQAVEFDSVVIEKFTPYGQADGECHIELEFIEKINVDDEELQDLKLLTRWHEIEPPV